MVYEFAAVRACNSVTDFMRRKFAKSGIRRGGNKPGSIKGCGAYGYAGGERSAGTYRNAYPGTDAYAGAYVNARTYRDADTRADIDAGTYRDAYSGANAGAYRDAHTGADANAETYRDPYTTAGKHRAEKSELCVKHKYEKIP